MPRQIPQGDASLSRELGARQPVWDLPTRLTHWLLAALIAFSWWSAEYHRTEWHIWSGCAILALLLFRLLWGLFGSSTARFSNFVRGPGAVAGYLRGHWRGIGHNPLGALSVVALLLAVAIQVGLGLVAQDEDGLFFGPLAQLVSSDTSDSARDLHEQWFDILLYLIVLHVAAIAFYRLFSGKKLTGAMISGRGEVVPGAPPMRPAKWWVALLCLTAAVAITRWVVAGAPPFGP
ncbi:MAG TPA: cytochrome b/b6 domain-containing protein [Sphingomicrobium sp.]|nr:cytochrome b/b6 domain-containing protein [Sphingomicrobium sp.]